MPSRAQLVGCLTLVAVLFPGVSYAGPHPVSVEANSNCLDCHAEHASGDNIHPAVKAGCTACHEVHNRDGVSTVSLKQTTGLSCFECHQAATYSNPHLPYSSGMCTRCHNPHVSSNAHLLRARVNELCLSCHLRTAETVSSPYMPSIALTSNNSIGHPYARHPVSGTGDPITGGEMSCLSCHSAHGAAQPHLLKMGAEIPEDALNQNTETKDICRKCHMVLWGLDNPGKKGKKKKR